MPVINVFSKTDELLESHECGEGVSISSWLNSNVDAYTGEESAPFTTELNGVVCPHNEILKTGDVLMIKLNPSGAALPYIYAVILVASAYYSYQASKAIDNLDQNYEKTSSAGRSIYSAGINNNSAYLNGYIRDVAGSMDIYPDLIVPPHRRFENNEEFIYLGLSIGQGHYFIKNEDKFIGETQIINLSNDVSETIIEPAGNVSSFIEFENWVTSKEVNSLTLTTGRGSLVGNWTIDLLGDQITSYLNGNPVEFPFINGEVFEIFEILPGVPAFAGLYQVVGISGASNEIGQVVAVERSTGDRNLIGFNASSVFLENNGYFYLTDGGNSIVFVDGSTIPSFPNTLGWIVDWAGISGGINREGEFRVLPAGETARYSEVDVFFPRGLVQLNDEGEEIEKTLVLACWWRDESDPSWTQVAEADFTFTGKSRSQLGFTVTIDHGSEIIPVFQFQRATLEPTDTNTSDMVQIRAIRSKIDAPTSYDDITAMAVRMRGTNALARTAQDKINLRGVTRKLPTLTEFQSGSWDLYDSATNEYIDYNVQDNTYIGEGDVVVLDIEGSSWNGFVYGLSLIHI